ncbi:MAG: aminotransferase class III-fold pyridoxal phosphate-dependent enzyme [Proteobacteria bacterium]|nr:aminotransferase class III-fold pyridoxal phosphate-dependent enzyme [Pseudomonadota bacterium]
MTNLKLSLNDLLGEPYINAVCGASAFLQGEDIRELRAIAEQKIDFSPQNFQQRLDDMIDHVGTQVCERLPATNPGAGTESFKKVTNINAAPLAALGFIRVGEDGRAYITSKSEHYHVSLGHSFPGYRLIEHAKRLGIANATHNNTRGYITRLLEQELVRVTNGIARGDTAALERALRSNEPHVLNRVTNLETGSLAVEAALKMMLARFYRLDETFDPPLYAGRTPVFLVVADLAGGRKANYHGTAVLTQVMRDMWPEFAERLESSQAFLVRSVKINDFEDFEQVLVEYDSGPYKVAGFFHEIVLMNYGGIKLDQAYLSRAYELCDEHDVPTIVDEIQSCIWAPELFLYREYQLTPDFVSIGKGFPGGEYPASKIISSSALDNLNQFGALVTNGQEEMASLTYLITIAFAEANSDYTKALGDYYESELRTLAGRYSDIVDRIEGNRHLSSIFFYSADTAVQFITQLNQAGIDISAQTYKAECPPVALTKIPLISSYKMVDFLIAKMYEALKAL